MHSHDDNHDVEGVEQPIVNHLEVGGLGHHLVDGGLNGGHHHHRRDRNHHPILEEGLHKLEVLFELV